MQIQNMKWWLGIGALCASAAGCHEPVTEIVLVVDSDLSVPAQIDSVTINGAGAPISIDLQSGGVTLPATLGLLPTGSDPPPFTLTAEATRQGQVVAKRGATNVRFVQGQRRALLLSLIRACACLAPPCAASSDPQCADLNGPDLAPLDPHNLPTLPRAIDGGADGPRDGVADAPALDGNRDLGANGDSGAPDQPPPPLDLGSACSVGNQCNSGNCADGVCCADACLCGQCNGAKPGTCVPVAVDTDPKASCGAYTCDGAGSCRTACSGSFGSCSTSCKDGYYCDGAQCAPSSVMAGFFCVAGGCECKAGLTCRQPDAGGAGICQ